MQTFIRIVEAGSITKAAAQLNTVKSAISKRLTNLEHSLGITLLNRTTRSQTLTDNGTIYYQRCLQIVDDVNELESSLKNDLCALSGTIRIAAPLSFGLTHLSKALTQFNAIQTQIKFDIDFNDRKIDIINEGFDLAIRKVRRFKSNGKEDHYRTNPFVGFTILFGYSWHSKKPTGTKQKSCKFTVQQCPKLDQFQR